MKAGKNLERYVQFVYQKLLEFMDEGTLVSKNVSVKGKSGVKHEFDVYYELDHLNIKYGIAIECKDWNRPVDLGEVRDFSAKLNDINNVLGVMVAKSGYQSGVKKFAESKGIKLIEEKDLPTISDIVAGVIKKGFLPNNNVKGAPFWTLMEVKKGEVTGTYFNIGSEEKPVVPFFFSKILAEKFRNKLLVNNEFEVRGVSQYQLKGFLTQMEVIGVQMSIYAYPVWIEDESNCPFLIISMDELKELYIY